MNFRDAYKSMNDEIHGDKALMHMIINGETPKKKKNFFLKFKPAYSVAIAAVFAVCAITLYHSTGFDDYSATTDKYDSVMTKGDKTPESDNDKTQNVTNSKNKDDDLNAADKSVSAQDTEDSTDYASQGNAEFDNTHNNYDNGNAPTSKDTSSKTGIGTRTGNNSYIQDSAETKISGVSETEYAEKPASARAEDNSADESADSSKKAPKPTSTYNNGKSAKDADKKGASGGSAYSARRESQRSGGGAEGSANIDSIIASAILPDGMHEYKKEAVNGAVTIEYIDISSTSAKRSLEVTASTNEADCTGDTQIKLGDVYVSVESQGLTDSEVREFVDSLGK